MLFRSPIPFAAGLRLLIACCLCLGLWPATSQAKDLILEKSQWTDPTGSVTFEQAKLAPFAPYAGVLSKGFGQEAQWIKLKIDAVPAGASDTLVLRIRPVFLDEITLYDPMELASGRAARTSGDRTPVQSTEFESLHHTFVIAAQDAPREVWLRLRTSSTQLIHVEALTPREMLRQEHSLWLAYSALLAILFSCLLWVFISWLQDRDPVNGVFVLRQTVLLAYTACYLGYHRILLDGWLSPLHQDLIYGWTLLLTTTLSVVFEYRLLREYAIPKWGVYLLRLVLASCFIALMLMLADRRDLALPLNTLLVGLGILSMYATALFIPARASAEALGSGRYLLPKSAMVAYYAMAVALLAASVLPGLGLFGGTLMSIYGVLLYGLLSGLLMTALLIVRSHRMERLRREQANHLFLSREQLAIESRRRQDQSQLLNMLMHELKTPLAVIDLALKDRAGNDKTRGYVARAIDNMQSILDRCVQTDRLVDRPFEVQSQRFDLVLQLQRWVQDNPQAVDRLNLHTPPAAYVFADLQCVQIIVSNLIENALKYGDPLEPVEITLQTQTHTDGSTGLSLSVCNTQGMAGRPDAGKVFAKYYRSAAAQRQSGTGLGLFLSHNLARQIRAELHYRPTTTHICFELWLPN